MPHPFKYCVTAHRAPHIRSRSLCPVFKDAYLRDQSGLRMANTLGRPYHENLRHPVTSYKY